MVIIRIRGTDFRVTVQKTNVKSNSGMVNCGPQLTHYPYKAVKIWGKINYFKILLVKVTELTENCMQEKLWNLIMTVSFTMFQTGVIPISLPS